MRIYVTGKSRSVYALCMCVSVCKKEQSITAKCHQAQIKTYAGVSSPRILNWMVTNFINFSLTLEFVWFSVVFSSVFFFSRSDCVSLSISHSLSFALRRSVSFSLSHTFVYVSDFTAQRIEHEIYVLNRNFNTIIMFSNTHTPNHCLYCMRYKGF